LAGWSFSEFFSLLDYWYSMCPLRRFVDAKLKLAGLASEPTLPFKF